MLLRPLWAAECMCSGRFSSCGCVDTKYCIPTHTASHYQHTGVRYQVTPWDERAWLHNTQLHGNAIGHTHHVSLKRHHVDAGGTACLQINHDQAPLGQWLISLSIDLGSKIMYITHSYISPNSILTYTVFNCIRMYCLYNDTVLWNCWTRFHCVCVCACTCPCVFMCVGEDNNYRLMWGSITSW